MAVFIILILFMNMYVCENMVAFISMKLSDDVKVLYIFVEEFI